MTDLRLGGPWRPPPLRPGDTVAVLAPAGPVDPVRLDAGLGVLRGWGLTVVEGAHLRGRHPRLAHLSGEARNRAADLAAAWTDPRVRAVWAARGGFGSAQLVDLLDATRMRAAGPKHLIGFSDVTTLHAYAQVALGVGTTHGPMVGALAEIGDSSREQLRRLLMEPPAPIPLLAGLGRPVPGEAAGLLVGGNLAIFADVLEACAQALPPGAVLALEEIGEQPYRLDRTLTRLTRSGPLARAGAIVVGDLTDCGDPEQVRTLLLERLGDLGIPVALRGGFGHEDDNLALPLGSPVRLRGPDLIWEPATD